MASGSRPVDRWTCGPVDRVSDGTIWRNDRSRAGRGFVRNTVERDHVHLIVEASDERALARGMQGFEIAAAHRLNAAVSKTTGRRRRGRVFSDRYHARILRTPTQVRHALNYVLNNWRHHSEHQGMESMFWEVDYFSTGPTFVGWREPVPPIPTKYQPLPKCAPVTWLLSIGWAKSGEISMYATPGRE